MARARALQPARARRNWSSSVVADQPMGTIAAQAVRDETVAAIKAYAAEAGVSPGETVARLVDLYTQLRASDDANVLAARRSARLP